MRGSSLCIVQHLAGDRRSCSAHGGDEKFVQNFRIIE